MLNFGNVLPRDTSCNEDVSVSTVHFLMHAVLSVNIITAAVIAHHLVSSSPLQYSPTMNIISTVTFIYFTMNIIIALSPLFLLCRYVPEAGLLPTDPHFLQFHKVFEAFQVSSCNTLLTAQGSSPMANGVLFHWEYC